MIHSYPHCQQMEDSLRLLVIAYSTPLSSAGYQFLFVNVKMFRFCPDDKYISPPLYF